MRREQDYDARRVGQEGGKTPVDWPRRLGKIRDTRGWSRKELAEAVGVSPRTIEGWEGGRHRPDRRAVVALREIWRAVKQERAEAREGSVST